MQNLCKRCLHKFLGRTTSELALQTMKDPYVFDFIPFKEDMVERDIENALVKDVTRLLLEIGTGFAFLGNQYHINVGGDDFYIDLLSHSLKSPKNLMRNYHLLRIFKAELNNKTERAAERKRQPSQILLTIGKISPKNIYKNP